jgi:hypothetical protein
MAIWQRLSYEYVARVFAGSLYLRRFAGAGSGRLRRQAGGGLPGQSKFKKGQV